MNDYACICNCGCKNPSGEYVCNDCMMKPRHRLAYYSFYLFSAGSIAGLTWTFSL